MLEECYFCGKEFLTELDEYTIRPSHDGYHLTCGCKMRTEFLDDYVDKLDIGTVKLLELLVNFRKKSIEEYKELYNKTLK